MHTVSQVTLAECQRLFREKVPPRSHKSVILYIVVRSVHVCKKTHTFDSIHFHCKKCLKCHR